jgi:hypothetical protein
MVDELTRKSVKKWSITLISGLFAVALALLYVIVLRGIAVQITPPPEPRNEPYPDVSTKEMCEKEGGRWVESQGEEMPGDEDQVRGPRDEDNWRPYCRGPLTFEREREINSENSRQTSLFVFAVGGALAIALSLLVMQLRPVAPGLMVGGIVAFFIAGVHVWTLAPGIGRLITIVVIFLVLMGIGMYVFRERDDKDQGVVS